MLDSSQTFWEGKKIWLEATLLRKMPKRPGSQVWSCWHWPGHLPWPNTHCCIGDQSSVAPITFIWGGEESALVLSLGH
jgi:hypothetical protein